MGRVGWRANVGSTQLLLDTYTGATVAYSLRKLKSTYSGSAIRVRRSIDNYEKDISFDSSGNLDTNALLDFVGYPNAFLLGSEALSTNSAFTATALTITGNWLTGPDGVTPGNKLTETTAFNYHNTGYSIISGNNATFGTHNFSGYLKKGTGSAAPDRIAVGVGNGTYYMYAIFNLSTGTIETQNYSGTVTNYSAQMTSSGNGWYRCSVGGVLNFPGTQSIRLSFQFVNNSASYNPFTSTGYVGNVNADVQVTQVMWIKEVGLQRYGKTLNSGGGTQGGGFVTTWYDQSGNGTHATQTTAANQPQIVSNGSLITSSGGIVSLSCQNKNLLNSMANTFTHTQFIGMECSTTGNSALFGLPFTSFVGVSNGDKYSGIAQSGSALSPAQNFGSPSYYVNNTLISATRSALYSNTVTSTKKLVNITSTSVGSTVSSRQLQYEGYTGNYKVFEVIIYNSDQSSNRVVINNNINSYYSIY